MPFPPLPLMLGAPPPFMMGAEFDPFHDDFDEDPFDVIREIEAKKRQRGNGFFGGPPTIDVHPTHAPDLHPALVEEVGLSQADAHSTHEAANTK